MSDWELYYKRLTSTGSTKRQRESYKLKNNINNSIENSELSRDIKIDNISKKAIINSKDNPYLKQIIVSIDDCFNVGSIIDLNSKKWIVTEKDFSNDIYCSGNMLQCNGYFVFQNNNLQKITTYFASKESSGNLSENKTISVSDNTFKIKIQSNSNTNMLTEGKRLLIGKINNEPQAYKITKIDNIFGTFNNEGILILELEKDKYNSEIDNSTLMIADYKNEESETIPTVGLCDITYTNSSQIVVGGSYKSFNSVFYDENNNIVSKVPVWTIDYGDLNSNNFTVLYENNNSTIKIKAVDNINLIGETITLNLTDSLDDYVCSLSVKVVNLI